MCKTIIDFIINIIIFFFFSVRANGARVEAHLVRNL